MPKSFDELVEARVAWRKSKGSFDYSTLAEDTQEYWRDRLGDLYKPFYADVRLGVSIGIGWADLYVEAANKIQNALDCNPTIKLTVEQVKEKFGGLRLYVRMWAEGVKGDEFGDKLLDPSHDIARQLINAAIGDAQDTADRTCEFCGKPGTQVAPRGWVHIACAEHTDL